jgi:hypothetical protein
MFCFDPKHEEFESSVQWTGGKLGTFQPEEFDLKAINSALSPLRWPVRHRP